MSNQFIAEIRIFAGNFAPQGWAQCNGQLLSISQNTALFSLLGTTYGGDGRSNFALPNLQGSAPMNQGQGPGLSMRDLGEIGGQQAVTLLQTEMASHTHTVQAFVGRGTNANAPGPALGIANSQGNFVYDPTSNSLTAMSPQGTSITGQSLPHNNMQPFLGLMFIIALQGVFPARG